MILYIEVNFVPQFSRKHSLRVGWRNLVRVSLIFAIIVSFMLFRPVVTGYLFFVLSSPKHRM